MDSKKNIVPNSNSIHLVWLMFEIYFNMLFFTSINVSVKPILKIHFELNKMKAAIFQKQWNRHQFSILLIQSEKSNTYRSILPFSEKKTITLSCVCILIFAFLLFNHSTFTFLLLYPYGNTHTPSFSTFSTWLFIYAFVCVVCREFFSFYLICFDWQFTTLSTRARDRRMAQRCESARLPACLLACLCVCVCECLFE